MLPPCQTLCDPVDCSPPGSSVHGILQARILEWVAMPASRGSSRPGSKVDLLPLSCIGSPLPLVPPESEVAQSCPTLCDRVDCSPPGSSIHGILQARILEWVAISFCRGSSRPRDRTQVSHIAGRRFNLCTTREALKYKNIVSQKTSYRDTELQIQVLTSKISME